MRNLRNIGHRALYFADGDLTATTFDLDTLICAFGPTPEIPTITLKRIDQSICGTTAEPELITSWDAPSPTPHLPCDRILSLHCFSDSRLIILVLAGGDIVVVRQDPQPGEDLIEIVGSVDAGIAGAKWSPDDELLAIATKADTLLFMSREFDGIANITLGVEDLKISNHVSVGWGKKETQFKGRGVAKTLRDPTVPESIDEGRLSERDVGQTEISWRGDGQFVAVNSILEGDVRRRVIRVYSREGVLESVSEPIDGLEGAVSWKPSGQVIAGIQRREDRVDIVFFERNGLRHGEFDLRLSEEECQTIGRHISLDWNIDSTILAVSLEDRVQLWTMRNYHYYLKQVIPLDGGSIPASLSWSPEQPLHLACQNGQLARVLTYSFSLSLGSLTTPHDLGLVASVDGKKLKVTPLRSANVPPPMALDEIELLEPATDVAFNLEGTRIAVLHPDGMVSVWECDYSAKPRQHAFLIEAVRLGESVSKHHHHFWRQIEYRADAKGECTVFYDSDDTPKIAILNGLDSAQFYKCPSSPISMLQSSRDRPLCLQDYKGDIYEAPSNHVDELHPIANLPARCATAVVRYIDQTNPTIFGLSSNGVLHIVHNSTSQKLRIPGCTSFLVTSSHLIYTTSQHLLKFVHLHNGELEVPPDEPEKDERCRNIERGAKLVTVMPSAHSLVLQMPRGNIETVYPRALVLAGIRVAVSNRDYKKAFLICRTQRVDMNILHDYAPTQFMQDVGLLIKQVKKVEYIDLFLSSLSEENVAQTIYQETLVTKIVNSENRQSDEPPSKSKVNAICDAFLRELDGKPSSLQNIVTAHVCKNPPDLKAGLSLVSTLRKEQKQDELEKAVEHICFLADVNQLYDTALGLYDLDVALLVAQQSQKDPREYLPYLQSLHEMPPLRQRFHIDDDLKRHEKALAHLHTLESFDELKLYMSTHELYSQVLDLYRYDSTHTNEIMRVYASFLSSRNRYKEAGLAYDFIQDYGSAYEAYRSAGSWQESLSAASLVPIPHLELLSLATSLAETLEEAKDYPSAATIHLTYLSDLETALRLHCKAFEFPTATRLLAQHSRPDLLTSLLDPALIDASATITELLSEMKTQLLAQVPRLRDLREKKLLDPMSYLDSGDADATEIPDNISLAPTDASTSAGTFLTRYTGNVTGTIASNATRKTSKNRRREERKRARGKKGTVYEEEYLVASIARLMERFDSVMEDVQRLVEGLVRRGMRERGRNVEGLVLEVEAGCKGCVEEVFGGEEGVGGGVGEGGGYRPTGGEGVHWDAVMSAGRKREAPTIREYKRVELVGGST